MSTDEEIVVLETAKSPMVANMIVQALKFEGIPAYVGGCLLEDPYAMSQRLVGTNCMDIEVPKSCLKEAKAIITRMREAGDLMEDPDDNSSGST
jgi:hypothetical protein